MSFFKPDSIPYFPRVAIAAPSKSVFLSNAESAPPESSNRHMKPIAVSFF